MQDETASQSVGVLKEATAHLAGVHALLAAQGEQHRQLLQAQLEQGKQLLAAQAEAAQAGREEAFLARIQGALGLLTEVPFEFEVRSNRRTETARR